MVTGETFVAAVADRGYRFFTGVPCSYLTPLLSAVLRSERLMYLAAANEGDAVAAAAGAWLAGQKTVVLCQNSGLGNAVNPLTSLNDPFRIPTLLVVSRRGEPGTPDEPQHQLMGRITPDLLEMMRIPCRPFPQSDEELCRSLEWVDQVGEQQERPAAFIVSRSTIEGEVRGVSEAGRVSHTVWREDRRGGGPRATRVRMLEAALTVLPEPAAIVATTGKTGRELYTLVDRVQHLYQVGSMGCASSIGLGIALCTPRPVVVLDGDGAALMRMGAMATIGHYGPANLVHVILDNGVHDSTGGQFTVSGSIDFAAVAAACGYRRCVSCDDVSGFRAALADSLESAGPHLLHVQIATGSIEGVGRPGISPAEVARRFRAFLQTTAAEVVS